MPSFRDLLLGIIMVLCALNAVHALGVVLTILVER